MKESKALEKWCPFTQVVVFVSPVTNVPRAITNRETYRPASGQANSDLCLGSKCMAWVAEEMGEARGHCGLIRES